MTLFEPLTETIFLAQDCNHGFAAKSNNIRKHKHRQAMPALSSRQPTEPTPAYPSSVQDETAKTAIENSDSRFEHGTFSIALQFAHHTTRVVEVQYEIQGRAEAPVIAVLGGISADCHVAACEQRSTSGWWDAQVGQHKAIDTLHCRVLSINWLGCDGELDFPIDTRDQASALLHAMNHLHIDSLDALIGCSYGAMVAQQFATAHPSRLQHLILISGAHRAHPFAVAWRDLQRRIVQFGSQCGDETSALSLARQLAILSYRSPQEFADRFNAPVHLQHNRVHCQASDYLRHCGSKYVAKTPSAAFLRLSESIDLHQVDPAQIKTPCTAIGVEEDFLVPIDWLQVLVSNISAPSRLHRLRSRFGHDAFLVEREAFDLLLRHALSNLPTATGRGRSS